MPTPTSQAASSSTPCGIQRAKNSGKPSQTIVIVHRHLPSCPEALLLESAKIYPSILPPSPRHHSSLASKQQVAPTPKHPPPPDPQHHNHQPPPLQQKSPAKSITSAGE